MNVVVNLAADFGEWLSNMSKNKTNAIILVILSIFSPIGFIFAASLIAHAYRSRKKR